MVEDKDKDKEGATVNKINTPLVYTLEEARNIEAGNTQHLYRALTDVLNRHNLNMVTVVGILEVIKADAIASAFPQKDRTK